VRGPHFAADPRQASARTIDYFTLPANAAFNLVCQLVARFDSRSDVGQQWHLSLLARQRALNPASGLQSVLNVQQIGGLENGASLGVQGKWTDVAYTTQ
jgi:hypothetical protein